MVREWFTRGVGEVGRTVRAPCLKTIKCIRPLGGLFKRLIEEELDTGKT